MRQPTDMHVAHGNNVWGRPGTTFASRSIPYCSEIRIVGRENNPNGDSAQEVEDREAPIHGLEGITHILPGMFGLASNHGNELWPTDDATSEENPCQHSLESAKGSSMYVFLEGSLNLN